MKNETEKKKEFNKLTTRNKSDLKKLYLDLKHEYTQLQHSHLEILKRFERAREILSGEIIPDNPDNKERYEAHKKKLTEKKARKEKINKKFTEKFRKEKKEKLQKKGLKNEALDEALDKIIDESLDSFLKEQYENALKEELQKKGLKKEELRKAFSEELETPTSSYDKYSMALKELDLIAFDRESQKRETKFKNILFFFEYLDLIGRNPSGVVPHQKKNPPLTKKEAIQHLAESHQKSVEAVIIQLKRGKQALIERNMERAKEISINADLDEITKNKLIKQLKDNDWLKGILPPQWLTAYGASDK